ncbi:MAG TPA: glycosyltransferase [Candidatus Saccharimonadales bacterium]|nr:glycosyltransferase [Candidatus Saccharimonadales bacterium]
MKIGFFTETYLPSLNGVSVTLDFEKRKLESLGHQVYVFAPKSTGDHKDDETITRLSSMKLVNSEPAQKLVLPIPNSTLRRTFRVGLDIVHAHGGGFFSFLGYQLAVAKGYPYVLTYHAYLAKYSHYFFIKNEAVTERAAKNGSKLICNLADVVIVPTEKMKKILQGYGVNKKIEVVANPIDLEKFKKVERGFLRSQFSIGEDKVILLTASRLGVEKNIEFLLRSYQKVTKKEEKSVFVIAGDGPNKKKLEDLVKELKIEERVIFTGFVATEAMPQVYSDSDVFLFASTSETQGMVVPEAAACGLPVIVVKDEAYVEAVTDSFNGYVVKEQAKAFAEKILELINDQPKRLEFGANSEKLISENFDNDVIIEKLVSVYREAIRIRKQEPRVSNRIRARFKSFAGLFRYVKELNRKLGF